MTRKKNLTGERFGNLQVLCEYSKRAEDKHHSIQWVCQCDCGNEVIVKASYLTTGHKTSCGCLRWSGDGMRTHGLSGSRIYEIYHNMKRRCYEPNNKSYENYGGRGIRVCEEWNTFENFLSDMAFSYKENLTIERKDVNSNYCKENCTWATKKEQANNTRENHLVTYKGEVLTVSQLADKYNKDYGLIRERINKGKSIDEAFAPIKEFQSLTFKGKTKTITEFAQENGLTYHQVKKRLMRGWSTERALTEHLREW